MVHAVKQAVSWLFEEYRARGLPYCVLRNYEALPDEVENDLDLLIRAEDLDLHEAAIQRLARELSWRVFWNLRHCTAISYGLYRSDVPGIQFLYIDLIIDLTLVRSAHLQCSFGLGRDAIKERVKFDNFYILSPDWQAVHLILHGFFDHQALARGTFLRYFPKMKTQATGKTELVLAQVLGRKVASGIISLLQSYTLEQVTRARGGLWREVLWRPGILLGFARHFVFRIWGLMSGVLSPPGYLVAITGPSGNAPVRIAELVKQRWGRANSMLTLEVGRPLSLGAALLEYLVTYFKIFPALIRGRVILLRHPLFDDFLRLFAGASRRDRVLIRLLIRFVPFPSAIICLSDAFGPLDSWAASLDEIKLHRLLTGSEADRAADAIVSVIASSMAERFHSLYV